ncbi:MAG TPA: DMT family transporter [Candidatus Binatia bacterium]|nr:DMT family transporter [Candidatus Binatia bacterium]
MSPRDLLYPLLAALCYSTNPILVKLGLRISNEPVLGASIGMVASTLVYLVYFLLTGQVRTLLAVPRWVGWYFALAGLGSTLGMFSFFAALQYIPAAVVAPLTSAAPLVTLILSHFTLKGVERVARADVVGTVLIVLGVILLLS